LADGLVGGSQAVDRRDPAAASPLIERAPLAGLNSMMVAAAAHVQKQDNASHG